MIGIKFLCFLFGHSPYKYQSGKFVWRMCSNCHKFEYRDLEHESVCGLDPLWKDYDVSRLFYPDGSKHIETKKMERRWGIDMHKILEEKRNGKSKQI